MAELAIEIAKGSASLASEKVKLADEPVYRDRVVTARRIDPFAVALEHKTALLLETMEYVHQQPVWSGAAPAYGLVGTESSLCRPKGRAWNSTSLP